MFTKLVLFAVGLGLTTTVSAVICHVDSSISHRQTSACGGAIGCVPNDSFQGGVIFKIDGEVIVNTDDFDKLTAR
ncbi:hypothetical protein Q7P37_000051 [Cladosporium fusiforme]